MVEIYECQLVGTVTMLCPRRKQSQRIFSLILFRIDDNLQNLEDLFLRLFTAQLQLHFRVIPLPETFYFNDVLQN